MDAALRLAQRSADPARQAILEARIGGGVGGWLDGQNAPLERRRIVRDLLRAVSDNVGGSEAISYWARIYALGWCSPTIAIRFPELVVLAFGGYGFPLDLSPRDWLELPILIDLSDPAYTGRHFPVAKICRTKRSIKDRYAREVHDQVVEAVRAWSTKLPEIEPQTPLSTFTLAQARVFCGLDPYGR